MYRGLKRRNAAETLKLCRAPWLASLRHTTLGHLVFGVVFSWQNLIAYTLGVFVGLLFEVLVLPSLEPVL